MKKMFFLSLLIIVYSNLLFAQEPNKSRPKKIFGIAKEVKPISYYKHQSQLWQALIKKEPNNSEAWNNYYRAERAKLQLEQPNLWANEKELFYKKLSPILTEANKYIGNSFDYYFVKGFNSQGVKRIDAFKQAYLTDPERSEVYSELLVYNVLNFNFKECSNLGKKILLNNVYSDANLKWNYNALVSVEKDAIIISNGDIDGIPKWVLQYGANVRKDVMVISKWLLADDKEYLNKIYNDIGISQPELGKSDFKNMEFYTDYLASDILKRSKRPAYISSGTSHYFFKENGLEGKMYLVGNVLKYSNKEFDVTPYIIENFEDKYYLEYIIKSFQHHQEDEFIKTHINVTYLPGLIHLKNHYKSIEEDKKVKHYDFLINKIKQSQ